jgi:hypothetical protein
MALGSAVGVLVGIAQVSLVAPVRKAAWGLTQFFRNAPWLVLLFYAMFLLPFEFRVFGLTIAFPGLGQGDHRAGVAGRGQCFRDRARRHPLDSRRANGNRLRRWPSPGARRCG